MTPEPRPHHELIAEARAYVARHNAAKEWVAWLVDALATALEAAERERDEALLAIAYDQRAIEAEAALAAAVAPYFNALEKMDALRGDLAAAVARQEQLEQALREIAVNAEDWHGPPCALTGHARALAVIASWARAALGGEAVEPVAEKRRDA